MAGHSKDTKRILKAFANKANVAEFEVDGRKRKGVGMYIKVYPPPIDGLGFPEDCDVCINGPSVPSEGCQPDCSICSKQYRPPPEQFMDSRMYAGYIDDDSAQQLASTLTTKVVQDQGYLRNIIEQRGNAILNRWSKLSENLRRDLIRKAVPDLYEKKAPQARIHYAGDGWGPKRAFRKTYLLPYLTVENICDNKLKLPSLLHHRTSSSPEDWVMFDSDQFRDAYMRGCLALHFNRHCVVLHGSSYGKLVPWEKEKAHTWAIVGWPRAQLILEAQSELMQCLRKVVDHILKDHSGEGGCGKWNQVIHAGLKAPGCQEIWATFGARAFSAPASFDPHVLLEIASTRMMEAEDRIWLFQTDAAYTFSQIEELRKTDFYKYPTSTDHLWSLFAGEIVHCAMNHAILWRWIAQELQYVCALHDEKAGDIVLGKRIPQAYSNTLGSLHTLVKKLMTAHVGRSERRLPSYAGIQDNFKVVQVAGKEMIDLKKPDLVDYFSDDPLFWAVWQLHNTDPRLVVETNRCFSLAFLDDWLTSATKQEKARVDQRLYDMLTDLTGMELILSTLRCRRPYSKPLTEEEATRTQSGRGGGLGAWQNCTKVPIEEISPEYHKTSAAALKVFFEVGLPKGKKDAAWVLKADQSRAALQAFWHAVSSSWGAELVRSCQSPQEVDYQMALLRHGQDPVHLAMIEKERMLILQPNVVRQVNEVKQAVPDWAANSSLPARPTSFKRKESQPSASVQIGTEVDIPRTLEEVDIELSSTARELVITVNKESLKFFDMMFGVTGHTGTVRWQRFVSAMVDAGCAAISNGGSAVTFRHSSGSIAFHRPHPEDENVPDVLRIMGKRLKKRLGWSVEVFVERTKGETKAQ
ncbi:hypothetical protein LTR17_015150 [Elasticomyces elasticus]|nr:hypothetical protein LTR17_015150 [Elasticomyces elasticus]